MVLKSAKAAILTEMIRLWFSHKTFDYIDLGESSVLHLIPCGRSGWVAVIGHPDNASYEWILQEDSRFDGDTEQRFKHSNQGYGSSVAALRDGLITMEGVVTPQQCDAAPALLAACEGALSWMTNVNVADPTTVGRQLMAAMEKAGYDKQILNDAAVALVRGPFSVPNLVGED